MGTLMETIKQASEHAGRRFKSDSGQLLPSALMRILDREKVPPAVSAWLRDVVRQEALSERIGAGPERGRWATSDETDAMISAAAPAEPPTECRRGDRVAVLLLIDPSIPSACGVPARQSA